MATIYGLWNGGVGYSNPSVDRGDLEKFSGHGHAKEVFIERAETSGAAYLDTYFVDRENESVRFPGVSESSMDVYLYDPREGDNGPDYRLSMNEKGRVIREHY